MIIYGYTPKTWWNKFKIYLANTNKAMLAAFIVWSIILWIM